MPAPIIRSSRSRARQRTPAAGAQACFYKSQLILGKPDCISMRWRIWYRIGLALGYFWLVGLTYCNMCSTVNAELQPLLSIAPRLRSALSIHNSRRSSIITNVTFHFGRGSNYADLRSTTIASHTSLCPDHGSGRQRSPHRVPWNPSL